MRLRKDTSAGGGCPGHNRVVWPEPAYPRLGATTPTPDWWKPESGACLSSGNSTTVGGVATVKELAGEESDWVKGSSELPGSVRAKTQGKEGIKNNTIFIKYNHTS